MGFEHHKRPGDYRTAGDPDLKYTTSRQIPTASTAASTALNPRGAFSFATTSTGAPVVYTISAPEVGDRLSLTVDTLASSSEGPIHFNTGTHLVVSSSADMISLSSVGAGISLIAVSTARWLADGNQGATFSTST